MFFHPTGIRDFIFSKSMLEITQKMVKDSKKLNTEADENQIGQYSFEIITDQHKDFVKS